MTLEVGQVEWTRAAPVLRALREAVFVVEQGIAQEDEWDGLDDDAAHFLAQLDGTPVGTVRVLPTGQIGRMAVLAQHRRRGIGRALLDAAVDFAARAGHREAFLHAQLSAVSLYAGAGFVERGPHFEEAGIEHVEMWLALPVPYEAVDLPDMPAPARRPQIERAPTYTVIEGMLPLREAALEVAARARRQLRLRSPDLNAQLFDTPDFEAAVSALARRHAQCEVRLLVTEPAALAGTTHRLLALARRLPSAVQIRAPRQPLPEAADLQPTLLIADESGYFQQPHSATASATIDHDAPARARAYAQGFDHLWERAHVPVELRELRI